MSAPKHTPGPWELCDRGDYGDFDGNSRVICGAEHSPRGPFRIGVVQTHGDPEDEANARLIAAAPELLEACKRLYAYHNAETTRLDIDALEAAIEKAEGMS